MLRVHMASFINPGDGLALRATLCVLKAHTDIRFYAYSLPDEIKASEDMVILHSLDKDWKDFFDGVVDGSTKDDGSMVVCIEKYSRQLKRLNKNVVIVHE